MSSKAQNLNQDFAIPTASRSAKEGPAKHVESIEDFQIMVKDLRKQLDNLRSLSMEDRFATNTESDKRGKDESESSTLSASSDKRGKEESESSTSSSKQPPFDPYSSSSGMHGLIELVKQAQSRGHIKVLRRKTTDHVQLQGVGYIKLAPKSV
eukprot:726727-Rhodomonas_salina.2